MANAKMLKTGKDRMAPLIREGRLDTTNIAAMLQDFKRQKQRLDFTEQPFFILHSEGPQTLAIRPDEIDQILGSAFNIGLQVLVGEVQKLRKIGKDFVVLLCGGSFGYPGLVKQVTSKLGRFEKGSPKVKHAFLSQLDQEPYPYVSRRSIICIYAHAL